MHEKIVKNNFSAESTLQAVISAVPSHIFWYDTAGVLLGCNEVQAKAFGYASSKEMTGTSI